jgi:hypothetical protein
VGSVAAYFCIELLPAGPVGLLMLPLLPAPVVAALLAAQVCVPFLAFSQEAMV